MADSEPRRCDDAPVPRPYRAGGREMKTHLDTCVKPNHRAYVFRRDLQVNHKTLHKRALASLPWQQEPGSWRGPAAIFRDASSRDRARPTRRWRPRGEQTRRRWGSGPVRWRLAGQFLLQGPRKRLQILCRRDSHNGRGGVRKTGQPHGADASLGKLLPSAVEPRHLPNQCARQVAA